MSYLLLYIGMSIGILVFGISLLFYGYTRMIGCLIGAVVGSMIIVLFAYLLVINVAQTQEMTLNNISAELGNPTGGLMIQDLSEGSLLPPIKNEGLYNVYHEGKTYLFKLSKGEVISYTLVK